MPQRGRLAVRGKLEHARQTAGAGEVVGPLGREGRKHQVGELQAVVRENRDLPLASGVVAHLDALQMPSRWMLETALRELERFSLARDGGQRGGNVGQAFLRLGVRGAGQPTHCRKRPGTRCSVVSVAFGSCSSATCEISCASIPTCRRSGSARCAELTTSISSPSSCSLAVSRYIGILAKRRIVEQMAKRLESQLAAADVFVPIDARAQRLLAVVDVKRLDALEADDAVEFVDRGLVLARRRRADSRRQTCGRCRCRRPARSGSATPAMIVGQVFEPPAQVACPGRPCFPAGPGDSIPAVWRCTAVECLDDPLQIPRPLAAGGERARDASRRRGCPASRPAAVRLRRPRSTFSTARRRDWPG